MKTPKQYNITPAKGQALLNFQGRRFPDKIDVFETELIEEVKHNNHFSYHCFIDEGENDFTKHLDTFKQLLEDF